jgi:hypothetical protein
MEHRTPIRILNNPTLDRKLQKAISRLKDPVEIQLTANVVLKTGSVEREKIVLEYGCPFVGIARPKGYRRRRMVKQCFRNAGILADEGRGTYCEGFARSESKGVNPAVGTYVETIPGGDQSLEMTKALHGGTRTCREQRLARIPLESVQPVVALRTDHPNDWVGTAITGRHDGRASSADLAAPRLRDGRPLAARRSLRR